MKTSDMLLFNKEFDENNLPTEDERNQIVRETLMFLASALQDVRQEISEIRTDLAVQSQED